MPNVVGMLPRIRFFGHIIHVHVPERVEGALDHFRNETFIGFDMEWKPGRNPVSIIQIAAKNTVALFYIQKLGGMPESLVSLLTDKSNIKVGCGMLEDSKRLSNEFGIEIDNDSWIDVQVLAQQVDHLPICGLKRLCEIYLGAHLDKRMAASNWGNRVLSPDQVIYAATDAWVVRHIFWSAFLKPTMNGLKHHEWFDLVSNRMAKKITIILMQTLKLIDSYPPTIHHDEK